MKQLTVKQALEQGYQHYDDGSGYAQVIEDIDEDDEFPHGATLYNPTPEPLLKVSKDLVNDIISEWVYNHIGEKVEEESVAEKASQKIKDMDFSIVANMINSPFEKDIVYKSTNIELIP